MQGRTLWQNLLAQYEKWSDRVGWCAENLNTPEYEERSSLTDRSGAKLVELRSALANWAGISDVAVSGLLGEVLEIE